MPMSDDKVYEQMMNDILAIYSQAENEMLEKVAKRVAKGITTEGWNESKLHDTQKLNKELLALVHQVNKRAKVKILKGAKVQFYAGSKKDFDKMEVPLHLKQLLKATYGLIDDASSKVLRNANDAYQQIMAHGTTGLLAGTDTRIQATQKMLNEYASKGITTFIDKAGRNWSLSSYAEMCARTVSSHAAIQGQIERQLSVGEDLVKVSEIGTTCPICMRWQGVVLSISGNHPKYHSLDTARAAGLFHPNCKHTITMFVPELDGEGKVEPSDVDTNSECFKRNKLIEKQRSYERNIRYWKNREAVAITDSEKLKAHSKIKYWQYKNMLHCEKNGLRRQYARECNLKGDANGKMGTFIGGTVKEFENLYKDVIGEDAKKPYAMLKYNLTLFSKPSDAPKYEKWLRDEILSLDELDIDKAQMKDATKKFVTPTSLYKKYIGDTPSKDWAAVSPYEKGTKEYKSGYAKWLKEQIEEIGVSYKVKGPTPDVLPKVADEDRELSATALYKKYHSGEKPTEAYRRLGGEVGTGMKYGKWVETEKKKLLSGTPEPTKPKYVSKPVEKHKETIRKTTETIRKAKELATPKPVVHSLVPRPSNSILNEMTNYYNERLKLVSTLINQPLDGISTKLKISKEEAKEVLAQDLSKMFNECEFGMRIKSKTIKDILTTDCGFKNLFEVGKSGGCSNKKIRGEGEDSVFGYLDNWTSNKEDRPVYGMLMPKYDGKNPKIKQYYHRGPGAFYGDGITLVFDKCIKDNVSFTIGDSLDYSIRVTGCEVSNPEFRGCHRNFGWAYSNAKLDGVDNPSEMLMKVASDSDRYIEIQIHGKQTKKDLAKYISHVYMSREDKELEKLLTERGIPFTKVHCK